MSVTVTVHATALVIGEAGILIRGEAGAGKSSLARQLLHEAAGRGLFSRLIGDDRVILSPCHGRVIARPVAVIEGAIEIRGIGIAMRRSEPAAVMRLVVDLSSGAPERMPEAGDETIAVCGVLLPRIRAGFGSLISDVIFQHASGNCDAIVTL
ncbi:HPr kinase/phosphorylase [Microvirga antarctica]|uniref:HPr kinase/phosphorylase n=1 Tax=Microvirga antarctica TaxID=2819233 RepID=UPI001B3128ED